MVERNRLEQAITDLEAQRAVLGDAVVDTTVAALREKVAALQTVADERPPRRTAQRKQVSILFAHVEGFTGLVQSIDDTDRLDVMNLLWRRLDGTITEHGGTIDKHVGNAVMGLFGVPVAHEHDPERAVRTALAMRAVLSDFVSEITAEENARAVDPTPRTGADETLPLHGLRLRIGINTGPVLLGEVGTGDEYTVIGDAVNVASRLERAAPPGGILISHDTYLLVRDVFNVEPLGPVEIKGKSDPVLVYMVLGVKPRHFYSSYRGVAGIETPMVGRDAELHRLQEALKSAIKTRSGQVVTVVGEAGIGKSRLTHEFSNWIQSLAYDVPLFKGRTDQRLGQLPYSLFRDLFATYFGIRDNDPTVVVREKLIQGMAQVLDYDEEEIDARAQAIAQLFSLNLSEQLHLPMLPVAEATRVQERAIAYVVELLEAITADAPAALMVLEDLHWTDESSLALIDHVVDVCRRIPLLVICLARPPLFERRSSWGPTDGTEAVPQITMELSSLSETESHQLVIEILRKLPEIPADLSGLIVSRAEGNPFYLEELIKVLIEDGVIITGEKRWRVKRNQLTKVRVPPTLTGVLQARLDRLSLLERLTLQRAAVVGRVFWDSVVIHMNEMTDESLTAAETMTALQALEKRELVFRRKASLFAGTQTYFFKHAILREVTYESVLLRLRPAYHKQVAEWLAEQSGERIAEYAGIIAEHFELAGEETPATELYEMAAMRAQEISNPEVAIDYYGRALSLLSQKPHHAAWQVRLQERLGDLLRLQARLVEAAQNYMAMRFTAEMDGDLSAQARAWNGLADVQKRQADYATALESATQAEQVAWLVSDELELARALLCKSEAHLRLDDTELALGAAKRALTISQKLHDAREITVSLSLLCSIYVELGHHGRAHHYLDRLVEQVALLEKRGEEGQLIAFNMATLGRLHNELGHYDKAAYYLLGALKRYRQIDAQLAIGSTLNALGETARLRGNPGAAVPLYRQALAVTKTAGDRYDALFYRTNLAGALVSLGDYQAAGSELHRVIREAKHIARVVNWVGLSKAYGFLALAYAGQGKVRKALAAALRAHSTAQELGETMAVAVAWRVLGVVLAQLPVAELPVTIDGVAYEAPDCFAESLRLLEEASSGDPSFSREQAYTLWNWSSYELAGGNDGRGHTMRQEAEALAQQLGITLMRQNNSPDAAK